MTRAEPTPPARADAPDAPEAPGDGFGEMTGRVLPAILYAGAVALLVRIAALPLINPDTYFHLRFGHEFLHGDWSLRHPGTVTPFATAHWLPTQWLPEVVMARFEDWFGLGGVAWLFGAMLLALLTACYLVARRWTTALPALGLTTLAFVASYDALSMRPQVLSYVFVVVYAGAWLRTREDGRLRWWLVPLTWLWAMVHGMWPVGIALGVVAVAGMALDRAWPRPLLGRALLVPALSAVAAALTPVGPALYGAVLAVGGRSSYFSEWGAPSFHHPSVIVLAVLLAATAVVMARRGSTRWFDLLWLMVAAGCLGWTWRTVPVAAMMLLPLAATHLRRTRLDAAHRPRRRELGFVAGSAVVALAVLAVVCPHTSSRPPSAYADLDPWISQLPAGTKVVDAWDLGGYLMWAHPDLDILGHGYGDTFTIAELQRNTDIDELLPGWDEELRRTGCTVALLRPKAPLAYALQHVEGWRLVHRGLDFEMLEAPSDWLTTHQGS